MSFRDDSIIRDERGRIVKGSPGLHRKPEQQSEQQAQPSPDASPISDASFDDDLIAAANSFGQPRTKTGRRAWCESLRDQKPTEYAQLLTRALARKGEAQYSAASATPITVEIVPCPNGYFIPGDEARALWAAKATGRPQLVIDNEDDPFIEDDMPDDD